MDHRAWRVSSCSRRSASGWSRRWSRIRGRARAFHAFNEWMLDDWTFNYRESDLRRAVPHAARPRPALGEVEWALEAGAQVIVMRAGPVLAPSGPARPATRSTTRSGPGSPRPACSWRTTRARAATTATPRSGAEPRDGGVPPQPVHRSITAADRPIYDTIAALVCHGVFARHPNAARRDHRERAASGCRRSCGR